MKSRFNRSKELEQFLSHYSPSKWDRITQSLLHIGVKYIMANYNLPSMTVSQIEAIAFGQFPEEVSSHRNIKSYQSMLGLCVIE